MTKELTGKVAIVTGAGRNIGRAIALTLAEGGASILVNARSNRAEAEAVAREIEAAGGKALVHIGDVADAKSVQAMADAAVNQFGRIDILVNNAALRREKSFAEMSYAEWREIMDVTLDGTFHCVKACLPALRQSGAGDRQYRRAERAYRREKSHACGDRQGRDHRLHPGAGPRPRR
jgi:3-oxoacyl-[acyl-carrier protein] reductase